MTKELINYNEICEDGKLIKIADGIRAAINKVLPEGDTAYKLLGLKSRKSVWGYGITASKFTKPAEVSKGKLYSTSEMSRAQIGFFGNMNNLSSLENLKNIVNYGVLQDPVVKENYILILIERDKDSLNRTVERKQGVIFRPYTPEEQQEYLARMDEKAARELGMGGVLDDLTIDADFGI